MHLPVRDAAVCHLPQAWNISEIPDKAHESRSGRVCRGTGTADLTNPRGSQAASNLNQTSSMNNSSPQTFAASDIFSTSDKDGTGRHCFRQYTFDYEDADATGSLKS